MGGQFRHQHVVLVGVAAVLQGRRVEQHHQHPGPLGVAQELVSEALSLCSSLDEAGDVGKDELVSTHLHDPQMRLQGRERVVGNLGLGGGYTGDQRALAGVRESRSERHRRAA